MIGINNKFPILVFSDAMATNKSRRKKESCLRANPNCPLDQEINILLLGQTGVGKSTFINAFANYLVNDTLEQAANDEMYTVIASSFSYTDLDFKQKLISIGEEDGYEQFKGVGESNTLQCRSFVFPIGNRNLRFIDTPGIGDTKGIYQDEKNFQEILNYIAQFEHLNAVFIMFKPNEERLTVLFRYSVYELLRHLHVGAKDNIVFIFTTARSTFFMPGSTSTLLRKLLDTHHEKHNVQVPFSRENTFLFDNEPFRYLALRKNGIKVNNEQIQGYTSSWIHSINEYSRLMRHINQCPLHATSNALSLNEAEQLVRKLPRPIAETARLIEENIQHAKEHKKRVNENPQIASRGIPQKDIKVERLTYPRTVCTGEKCRRVTGEGIDRKVEYLSVCHERCYLNGVKQETLEDPKIRECEVMDPRKGKFFKLL
jgi:energy-coupling factor transporter ATP-binding protein EcfA2